MSTVNEVRKKSVLLQVRLNPQSNEDLEEIMELTQVTSKTRIVNIAISLLKNVVETIDSNGDVIFEYSSGDREKLKLLV
jgi:hypothetical protein